jgi:hypothetical protein
MTEAQLIEQAARSPGVRRRQWTYERPKESSVHLERSEAKSRDPVALRARFAAGFLECARNDDIRKFWDANSAFSGCLQLYIQKIYRAE